MADMRPFRSRDATIEHAPLLRRHGYQIFVLTSDAGHEL